MGLVDLMPQAGTFVSRIPIAAIRERDHYPPRASRRSPSPASPKWPTRRISPGSTSPLRSSGCRPSISDTSGFHDADETFHETIALSAGFSMLWPMVKQMKVHLDRLRVLSLPIEGRMDVTIEEHQRIRDALARNDVEGAKAAMHDHLGVMVPYIDELSASYPDYFIKSTEAHRVPTI